MSVKLASSNGLCRVAAFSGGLMAGQDDFEPPRLLSVGAKREAETDLDLWLSQPPRAHKRGLRLVRNEHSAPDHPQAGAHIAKLLEIAQRPGATRKSIMDAWNIWVDGEIAKEEESDQFFDCDLSGLDSALPLWRATPLWNAERGGIDFEGLRLRFADFENANLEHANLSGQTIGSLANARLKGADLSGASVGGNLVGADLSDTNLSRLITTRANFKGANLNGAIVTQANFSRARGLANRTWRNMDLTGTNFAFCDLSGGDFTGAVLNKTDFTQADLSNIQYLNYTGLAPWLPLWPLRRNRMLGRYLGIKGVEASYGEPGFRRDAQDQDFIDDKYSDVLLLIRRGWKASLEASSGKRWLGKRLGAIRWRDFPTRLPKRLLFWFWSLTDYGRSVIAVTLIAALMVLGFSLLYLWVLVPNHDIIVRSSYETANLATLYAAARGFANLGIDDILHPTDHWGAIALFANQVSGYVFVGMLLAVLQNKFARRA